MLISVGNLIVEDILLSFSVGRTKLFPLKSDEVGKNSVIEKHLALDT